VKPLLLTPNPLPHFYRGGARIEAFRGLVPTPTAGDLRRPEELLGSTVSRWGGGDTGLTDFGDLGLLRDLVECDPGAWLGAPHVARWGSSPAVLVKLLDAGERLPVHVHPTRSFAAAHLDCPFGKSEAWLVLAAPAGGGTVFLGATRPVERAEWAGLVQAQNEPALVSLLHPITVHPGDGVFVPAGTPHAIDAGVFVAELQEPTDFSVLLEWAGFDIDGAADGHLGLGFDVALTAVRPDAVDAATVDRWIRRAGEPGAAGGRSGGATPALASCADPYFRAWWVRGPASLPAAFSVVIVTAGAGELGTGSHRQPITVGDALVVPHAAGELAVTGDVELVVAQPARPDASEPVEWDQQ